MRILLLEDDPVIADILVDFLNERYSVVHCFDGKEALEKAESDNFDLYVFDINVPGFSGIKLLQSLRDFNDTTPAIFITAYQEVKFLKEGFAAGANDFIRKPFELDELQARIENIRRQFNIDEAILLNDSDTFNPMTHQLSLNDQVHLLATKESAVLHYLLQNQHRIVSTDELLQNLWSYEEMPSAETIRTYIKNLRNLVGKERIINIRGEGYKFQ